MHQNSLMDMAKRYLLMDASTKDILQKVYFLVKTRISDTLTEMYLREHLKITLSMKGNILLQKMVVTFLVHLRMDNQIKERGMIRITK